MTTDELFAAVRGDLDRVAGRFRREHGGDCEEHRSTAYLAFAAAAAGWELDPAADGWRNWLRNRAWWRLHDERRRAETARLVTGGVDAAIAPDLPHAGEWLEDFLAGLSDDARTVVRLLLDSPDEICNRKGRPTQGRAVRHLVGLDWGWTRQQVVAVFREIKEALR